MASFTRQLNIYGFRKVIRLENGKSGQKIPTTEFQHPFFRRGESNVLEHIKRKGQPMKMEDVKLYTEELQKMMTEVQEMNQKHSSMNAKFTKLKKQYTTLCLEMKTLRQKHGEQQRLLTQILQFILKSISKNQMANKSSTRSLPAICEAEASKCPRQYFHIPEEKEKEAMEILKDGYAIIEEKYKNLLDGDLPALKNEYKNLFSSGDQENGGNGKVTQTSIQDGPVSEESVITDLNLATPDIRDLITAEPLGQETEDMPFDLEALLSQDINSILTGDDSHILCDPIMNRDEMHSTDEDLMELNSLLSKNNVNYTSDHVSESLTLMEIEEGEISLLGANGKTDELLMSDFGEEHEDFSDLPSEDVKKPSNFFPGLRDHDYAAQNISSQDVTSPTENVTPPSCMDTSEE
ncbi:PREDICTED: heat shock factor protein 3-like [Chinchilla lanigera]|uniref:heat shock factor protein 3-like n=1 Tax=Chinchilla lanigera TaxID=34839 RepID=UPI000696D19F|nr:PREDICTED: heat shock factor protein 3-like [Chinchilla lanigera]